MESRKRIKVALVGTLALAQLGVFTLVALTIMASKVSALPPLSPLIPYEQRLIDQGMIAAPIGRQPMEPYILDRVLYDEASLYVQYHLTRLAVGTEPAMVSAFDQDGMGLGSGGGGGCVSAPTRWPLPSWFPGTPQGTLTCVEQIDNVMPSPTAVIRLVFSPPGVRLPGDPPLEYRSPRAPKACKADSKRKLAG